MQYKLYSVKGKSVLFLVLSLNPTKCCILWTCKPELIYHSHSYDNNNKKLFSTEFTQIKIFNMIEKEINKQCYTKW